MWEIYLEPRKDDADAGELDDDGYPVPAKSHRELSFINLQAGGLSWLEAEKAYQEWLRTQGRG